MDYSRQGYAGTLANGSTSYQPTRRTIGPNSNGLPHLPSLRRCVSTLERSTQLLISTVSLLDQATSGYSRLKTITSHTKEYELVSEEDIANAQVEVAREIEPELFKLSQKATQSIYELEAQEYKLSQQVQAEEAKAEQRIHRQKSLRSGLSNIKRLQSLTRRKEELSRSVTELDQVIEQKRQEFAEIANRIEALEKSRPTSDNNDNNHANRPTKRLRRDPSNESRELSIIEQERNREVLKRDQELEIIQKRIEEKRNILNELKHKTEAQHSHSNSQDRFSPSALWSMYSGHYHRLEEVLQRELLVDPRDKSAYEEAFGRLSSAYLREVDSRQTKTDNELNKLGREKTRKLAQMRILCKQLFPEGSIGITMVRVLELLGESPQNEIYHKELLKEFPLEEEGRHNLNRVINILKQVGVLELILESREEQTEQQRDDEGQQNDEKEHLILRIKFDDGSTAA
ncbi:hypothetical protein BX616_004812 [Lobosporangium transversale]|uniref:DASH complex subunit SPC19 n=1 Tax=Lobosporangium transversale TaxID=64571 RepID=A0A1Y2GIH1_9FUNG|nr:Spc19-domain-containing protein [Lobosporangium transversale]KAF9897887.1 hypothetical protein BX616_004812 [Lobosporangium transversale]ORZ12035.1 Spc19-domain-containing protein [Lobosporangium transversale]|eukprot:XP_021879900.1 Spc19-domain-containing protein [Lobosporangium transversale]